MARRLAYAVFAVTFALLLILFAAPLGTVLQGGFFVGGRFTGRFLVGVFRNPVYAEGLFNSLRIAVGTTMIAGLLAVPLAWFATRYEFPGKKWMSGLILVPMILPPFVGAIGFQQILGRYGALNALLRLGPVAWLGSGRYAGLILLQALALYPIFYLNVTAALANVDPALEEAAENLGCRIARRFFRIVMPLAMPGIFAGAALVFIWSFNELGTPLIMNYTRCAPVQVYDALKEIGANPFPYALVAVMLAVSAGLYALSRIVFGRFAYAMQSKATTAAVARRLGGLRGYFVALAFLAVIAAALTPHVGVALTSLAKPGSWYRTALPQALTLANYREAVGHEMTLRSIRNSVLYASAAVAVNLVLGVAVAWVVVRSEVRFRGVLDGMAMLPLAVPGLVMAFGYLAISSRLGQQSWVKESRFWQACFDVRVNPTLFLVIAYAVRRLPYVVRSACAGLQQTAVVFEESAANLGAGPVTTLRRVTLPLIAANLVAGALLAFAFSMLEVSDSLMLAQRQDFYPITKTIYELFQLIGTGRYVASALGVWAMLFLTVTILGASRILGRKLGALFRV